MSAQHKTAAEQPSSDFGQSSPAAPQASEADFHRLFELASVGMAQADPHTGQLRRVNQKLCAITGYSADELLRRRVAEITHPDDREQDRAAFQQLVRGEISSFQLEKRYVRKDGTVVWVNVNGMLVRDAAGQPDYVMAIIQDITERQQAEKLLEQEHTLLRTLIDQIPDLIYVRDVANRFVVANEAVTRYMGGATAAELIGKTDADFYPAERAASFAATDQGVFADQAILNKEEAIRFPNGEERVILSSKIPIKNDQGVVTGLVGVGRDITEFKLVEKFNEISRTVLQAFNETNDLQTALQNAVVILHTQTGIDAVGIRLRAGEDYPYVAQMGFSPSFLKTENSLIACAANGGAVRDKNGQVCLECTCGLVISGQTDPAHPLFTPGGSGWTNDSLPLLNIPPAQDPRRHPRNQCIHHGYTSIALVPIRPHERILGLLQFNDRRQGRFSLAKIKLLETFAAHLGSAVLRLQAEADLRASEARHAKMVANIGDIIVIIGQEGIIRFHSPNIEKWFGWKPEEVVGVNALENVHPQERAAAHKFIGALMREPNATGTMECRYRCRDGNYKWIEFTGVNLLHDRDICGLLGNYQDITARKTAEAALRASEENYRQLFDTMLDGFALHEILCDDAGRPVDYRYISVNPAFERLTGLQAADVIDRTVLEIMPDTEPAWIERYGRVALTGEAVQFEDYSHALQRHFEVAAFSPGRGRFAVVFVDITERKQAQAKLAESEAILRDIMESTLSGFWDWNLVDNTEYLSPTFKRMFGYDDHEMENSPEAWQKIIFPEDLPGVFETFDRHIKSRGREPFSSEIRYRHRDGSTVWVICAGRVIEWAKEGTPIRMAGCHVDITERKQAEAALRASQNQLQSIFRSAPVGVGVVQSRVFVEINERVCEITGYRREELLGKSARMLYPSEAEFAWVGQEKYRQITRQGTGTVETRWQKKDGTIIDVLLSSTPLDAADLSAGVTFSALDITARKRAQESHARLATAVEQAAETVVITDVQGTILYANPAFEKSTGYTRAEALGQNPRLLKSGQHEPGFYQRMWDTLRHGDIWAGRIINRRKDGTLFDEEATISPVRDATGKVVNYVAVKRDVTREMQLENQLRQSQKMEAIGTLAGGVAHDFNNILSSIIMQTELIGMTPTITGEDREGLGQIRADAERAAHLTRQLLLFSRRQVLQSRRLDVNESVMNMTKMLQRIIGEDVHLHLHLHVTPLLVQADPGMLDQVLMNLAVNARDAMPGGGELNIETTETTVDEPFAKLNPEAQPGRYAGLSVRDTGGGIPPEILPRIFEPFFTTKEVGKGTGLGLATVFGIVKQHRGWLQVDNQPGQGVAFQIYLPLDPTAAASDEAAERPKPQGGSETILLVEDEAAVRQSLRLVLQRYGYTVIGAANGREALKLWPEHQNQIALLLTDLVMPGGVSGQELGRQLAAAQPKLKIIYISGYSPEMAGQELHLSSGENYLQKPLGTEQLLGTIRRSLDR